MNWLWWVKNEGGWLDRDKFGHFILHFLIVFFGWLVFKELWIALVMSELWGWIYEIVWDCWIKGWGASKKDLVVNNLGMSLMALFLLVKGG